MSINRKKGLDNLVSFSEKGEKIPVRDKCLSAMILVIAVSAMGAIALGPEVIDRTALLVQNDKRKLAYSCLDSMGGLIESEVGFDRRGTIIDRDLGYSLSYGRTGNSGVADRLIYSGGSGTCMFWFYKGRAYRYDQEFTVCDDGDCTIENSAFVVSDSFDPWLADVANETRESYLSE